MKIGIVGTGLIGGSVAWALKRAGVELYLDDADGATRKALQSSRLGHVAPMAQWVSHIDALVVSVPLSAIAGVLHASVPSLPKGAWLVDLSSVKRPLEADLQWARQFVSVLALHPMAGREIRGFEASSADLFINRPLAVVDMGGGFPPSTVVQWWQETLRSDPVSYWTLKEHDQAVGWVSHLPYLVSRALSQVVSDKASASMALAGPGFIDTTRVGRSDPELLGPMLFANRDAIEDALEAFQSTLREWRDAIHQGQVFAENLDEVHEKRPNHDDA